MIRTMKQHPTCNACEESRPIYEKGICFRCFKLRQKKPTLPKKDKQYNGSLRPATYKHDGL